FDCQIRLHEPAPARSRLGDRDIDPGLPELQFAHKRVFIAHPDGSPRYIVAVRACNLRNYEIIVEDGASQTLILDHAQMIVQLDRSDALTVEIFDGFDCRVDGVVVFDFADSAFWGDKSNGRYFYWPVGTGVLAHHIRFGQVGVVRIRGKIEIGLNEGDIGMLLEDGSDDFRKALRHEFAAGGIILVIARGEG